MDGRLAKLVGTALAFALVLACLSRECSAQTFHDDFNGAALDTTVWSVDSGSGQVVVANGVVTLSCSGGAFPVVTTRRDPFPSDDFRIRIGMRYVSQSFCGDGFGAVDNFWEDYYTGTACRPFLLWQDGAGLYVYSGSAGQTPLAGPPETGYHIFEWIYLGGVYQFSMDGIVRASGACAPRATGIFFGHPHPIGCAPWTSFELDFVDIAPYGATPTSGLTWGRLKQIYR